MGEFILHSPGDELSIPTATDSVQPQAPVVDSSIDSVGSPDFAALAEGLAARREHPENPSIPSRADVFIPPHARDLAFDHTEPPPYFLNAEEWALYSDRKAEIERIREEELRGTF